MSSQGLHAVPPNREPSMLTVDTGATGALTPRFLTLVVRTRDEWAELADRQRGHWPDEDLPAAS